MRTLYRFDTVSSGEGEKARLIYVNWLRSSPVSIPKHEKSYSDLPHTKASPLFHPSSFLKNWITVWKRLDAVIL